ncbi:hypothetical protein [Lysobacter capsici]|uniref:hypothetical protein n=1 Tax=Lysobacter capsici TaxID=435897 RepID=UPI0012FD3B97|nr:hypothetical protein [Lysobacter capsici]
MTLKSLDVQLRRSRAKPVFAGMTAWKDGAEVPACAIPRNRLGSNDDFNQAKPSNGDGDFKQAKPPKKKTQQPKRPTRRVPTPH